MNERLLRRFVSSTLREAHRKKKFKFDNWHFPTEEELRNEYASEYKYVRPRYGDVWPTFEDFVESVEEGEVKTITQAIDRKMEYRSRTRSIEELEDLVSTYNTPRDIKRIVRGYQDGASMPYPVVLRHAGRLRIMGGNSRMDVAFILGFNPKVLIVDVPEEEDDWE